MGGRRYVPERIGTAVQMVYAGLSFRKAAAHVQQVLSTQDSKLSPQTVRYWVLRYTRAAMDELREIKVPGGRRWSVWSVRGVYSERFWDLSYAELAWLVVDTETGYILSCHVQRHEDDEESALRAAVRGALASSDRPPISLTFRGFWTLRGERFGVGYEAWALHVIQRELPESTGIQLQGAGDNYGDGGELMVEELVAALCKALRRFDRPNSGDSINIYIYIGGWVITRNFFARQERLGVRTPAQAAGVTAPFARWADVVRMEAHAHIPAAGQR